MCEIYKNLSLEDIDGEIWKDIEEFPNYQVSNMGRVKSFNRNDELIKQQSLNHGYLRVGLWKNGKRANPIVHRLVAQTFIPNPENKPQVNHKNEIKTDNRVENLEWMTCAENNSYGTKIERSIETKRKMGILKQCADTMSEYNKQIKSKKVYLFSKDKKFIKEYYSACEAARNCKYNDKKYIQGNISGACRGERNHKYKNCYWYYEETLPKELLEQIKGDDGVVLVLGGMISAGKSTATKILSEHFNSKAFYEPVDESENPILAKFYEDKSRYSFELQMLFLGRRFKMIKQALKEKNNVLDRSIYEDQLFAKINYLNGDMEKYQYDMYCEIANEMMEEIEGMPKKAPDLMIYLEVPFETILERIKKRGRECELNPDDITYYRQLWEAYKDWYEEYDASPKIKINNYEEYDLSTEKGKQHLIDEVEKALKENTL